MRRRVFYVAHPLGAASRDGLEHNLLAAGRWLTWLRRSFPATTLIAPWIAGVLSGEDDADPAQREAGIVDAEAVIPRCDGIVLCGPRRSSGMERELAAGDQVIGFEVVDLVGRLWAEAPQEPLPQPTDFRAWAAALRGRLP